MNKETAKLKTMFDSNYYEDWMQTKTIIITTQNEQGQFESNRVDRVEWQPRL